MKESVAESDIRAILPFNARCSMRMLNVDAAFLALSIER